MSSEVEYVSNEFKEVIDKRISVLYVDDEPLLLNTVKENLEKEGIFKVDTSSSVEEATDKLTNNFLTGIISTSPPSRTYSVPLSR